MTESGIIKVLKLARTAHFQNLENCTAVYFATHCKSSVVVDLSAVSEAVYPLYLVKYSHGQTDSESKLITCSIFELLIFCLVELFLSLSRAFSKEG